MTYPSSFASRGGAASLSARARRAATFALAFSASMFVFGCNESTAPNDTEEDPCDLSTNLVLGVSVSGSLSGSDCQLGDNSFADRYRLVLTSTTQIQVDLSSTAFDAFVLIFDSDEDFIEDDDDDGGGNNARIVISLNAGTYYIVANSLNAGEVGAYQLLVNVVTP